MAAISSNIGSGLLSPSWDWTATTTWIGGVVPGAADDVTVNATRTTINQANISKWAGTTTITVASNAGFPSSGSFFCGTVWGEVLKIDYLATATTTQFVGCSVNETDPFYAWSQGGYIPNTSYVHSPAPIITFPVNSTTEFNSLIIQNGAQVYIPPGANLKVNNNITLRDGRLTGRGTTGTTSTITITATEPTIGYFVAENYQMNILDLDGSDTRSWGYTTSAVTTGSTSFTITMNTGTFAPLDEIAIYDDTPVAQRRRNQTSYRDANANFKDMDEGFDVASVYGNTVYVARRNGARAKVKAINTSGTTTILTVDKNDFLEQVNFKAGDTVVINSGTYTISQVRDSQYELGYYNFQTTGTFTDFMPYDPIMSVESAWSKDAYGAYATNTNWNALIHKSIYRREVVMEVEISPWSQYYSAGTRSTDYFGLLYTYDPAYRIGHRTQYDLVKTGYWRIYDAGDTILIAERGTSVSDYMNMSIDTAGLRTTLQQPAILKVDIRKNVTKAYVNNEQIYERFQINGGHRGLYGVFAKDTNVRVRSIRYSAPTQDLYITTSTTFALNDIVYESGSEVGGHPAGHRVVKIASKITSPAAHDDLAFAYRGAYDLGSWPIVKNLNGALSSNAPMLCNHEMGIDYYQDAGNGVGKYVTLDLGQTRTFTHVSFTPRTEEMGTNPFMKAVVIDGSPDGTTWTNIYVSADDTKRYQNGSWYNQIGFYSVGTQSYRFIRFGTGGHGGSAATQYNRYVNFGVHNFTAGYTLTLNNASDFRVGDQVVIAVHNSWFNNEDVGQYQAVKALALPENYFHCAYNYRTITAINGNTITLDGPFNAGYIEGKESIMKLNRNFVIRGYFDATGKWQKPYFRYNQGASTPRRLWLKNTQFLHVGSSRVSSSSWNRGVDLANQDYNNPSLVDGCSFELYNNSDANGLTFQGATAIVRNNYIGAMRDFRPYYLASYCGVAIMNNKFNSCMFVRIEGQKNGIFNYNEASGTYYYHSLYGYGIDGYTSPHEFYFRRNSFHGARDIPGIFDNDFTEGVICPVIRIEYNRWYAANYTAYSQRPTPNLNKAIGSDIHAEHPGIRLNQYRSDGGIIGWGNNNNWSAPMMGTYDFGRFGYDYAGQSGAAYHTGIKYPDADYVRFYGTVMDGQTSIFSIQLYRKDPVIVKVYLEIEYRHAMKYNRLQNGNWDYGKFRIGVITNGTYDTGTPVYTTMPTDDGWVRYTATLNNISTTTGLTTVFAGRGANSTFVDVRYVRAYVMTDNPGSVFITHNNFDISKYYNGTPDNKKGLQQLTTTNAVRVLQLKL